MEISFKIKERRKELGLTSKQVADIIGITASTLTRYENGKIKDAKPFIIIKLCRTLKIPSEYLFEGYINKVEYDNYGRMKYNPFYHSKNGEKWSQEDLNYLVNWHDKIGREEMSFALGRTEATISQKVRELRKKGIMKLSKGRDCYKREIKKDETF